MNPCLSLDANWEFGRRSEKVDKKSKELNREITNGTERVFPFHTLEMNDKRENP